MEKLKEAIVNEHFREFCFERVGQSSISEKIQIVYEYLKWTSALPVLQSQASKSLTKAAEYRVIGNAEFRRKNFIQSLRHYTKSVAVAPSDSQELAFAYANRSAAWLEIMRYHECLLDINRALLENYPEARKKKLLDRKKQCVAYFHNAINLSNILPPGVDEELLLGKPSREELLKSFNVEETEPPAHLKIPPPIIDFHNKTIPNASEKIKIKLSSDNGISIIATANIEPAEVLIVEKPFICGLKEEYIFTHCSYCFIRTESLIHCPNCSMVMYCSISCRQNAYEKFHRVECQIFSLLSPDTEDEIALMTWAALRTVLVATKQGQELDQIMSHPVYRLPLVKKPHQINLKERLNLEDYASVFHYGQFSRANNFNDFNSEFSLTPFLTVVKWLYLLKHSSFFGEGKTRNFKGSFTKREVFVGTLLLRTVQYDFRVIKEGIYNVYPAYNGECLFLPIGYGLFPLMNLLNHSCEPNVKMFSYENNLVARSIRPINVGEEIFDCYDTPYYDSPKLERMSSLLEKYNFECICQPCLLNWPIKEKLLFGFSNNKIVSDTVGPKKFQKYVSKFRKLKYGLNFDEIAETRTLKFLCEYASVLNKRFERPCRELIDCEALLELSLSKEGNFYNVDTNDFI